MTSTWTRNVGIPVRETRGGKVVSIVLSLISMGALSICLSRRVSGVRNWSKLPLVCWLTLFIYSDSIIFVGGAAILSDGFGVDSSKEMCAKGILLCLGCYMTTKVLIYYFLVERAYIIRKTGKPRMKSRLYLVNSFGMLIPYCVVIVLNFYFRFAIYEDGTCRIGMKRVAMLPLIIFDIVVNIYLTSLFLIPIRSLYSYQTNPSSQTRTVAIRTFIGSCCTLASSIVNLTVVMVLNGEPGWICLMCCNIDILFSVIVLHWITSKDNASTMPLAHIPRIQALSPKSQNPKRLVPHPPLSQTPMHKLGLQDYDKMQPNVMTYVTACKDRNVVDDFDRIHPFPPNAITVSRDLVRAVDDIGHDNVGSEASVNDGLHRMRSESEDGLFNGKS